MVSWVSLGFSVVATLSTMGYNFGVAAVRISSVEATVAELKSDMKTVSDLKVDIATIKERASTISESLARLERNMVPSTQRPTSTRR